MTLEPRHVLMIEPGSPGTYAYQGRILFHDGTEAIVYGDERAQVIAAAQRAVEQYHQAQAVERETLVLNHAGEIVRDPEAYSVRVAS